MYICNALLWMAVIAAQVGAGVRAARAAEMDPDARDMAVVQRREALRLAITDLLETFGTRYPEGRGFLRRLSCLEQAERAGDATVAAKLAELSSSALLANPLLAFDQLLLLQRRRGQLGLPANHKCNAGIEKTGYDNEIALLAPVGRNGNLRTLYRPMGSEFVGELDLHYAAERLLFTMPAGQTWQIHEIKLDGSGLRQVTRGSEPDVDNFDACYLPDGRIVFASTASLHAVPCWDGVERACSLYRMHADGSGVRQLCFDQDLDLHPAVLPSGQVIYSRWEYAGTMHMYLRPLMVMNPDGTGQRAIYGGNSYWPNALYFPRGIPNAPNKLAAIVAGYHGVPRMGELVLLDLVRGGQEADGIVQRIPGRNQPVVPVVRDRLVDDSWPKFLHPYPLSDKYFLVAAQLSDKTPWGIYVVDVFDNIQPLCVKPGFDLFEPIPVRRVQRPPVIPDRVDLNLDHALVYVHNVYTGPGLAGVPLGTVQRLRIAAYHFGYPGLAGPDKIGSGGPWEAVRILGTVPVQEDGSASFRVPANTPFTIQPLDAAGKALQLMRSWCTAMPGEILSCVGCHERPGDSPAARYGLAARQPPAAIEPWYGPARGFDFQREVQPVLDRHCVGCHDGKTRGNGQRSADLRSERLVTEYGGRQLTQLESQRLHPAVREALGGTSVRYTPAYESLLPFIRRVNIEDDVHLLVPGEYHADTSELIQMLEKGHYGVRLDQEAWDRLITWIDLNAPCHGRWSDVCPVPEDADRRRLELARLYSGPTTDPEADSSPAPTRRVSPAQQEGPVSAARPAQVEGWPPVASAARRLQPAVSTSRKTIQLDGGVTMTLARIPAGQFVMGSTSGEADERPRAAVSINADFFIGTCEVTNAQFRCFDPHHDSRLFTKRFAGPDGPGLSLNGPTQPAVRVSWNRALDFCAWLSRKTGMQTTLPTEAQWEYACRAGSATPFSFGAVDADFSRHANMADKALSLPPVPTGYLESNLTAGSRQGHFPPANYGGDRVCDARFDDGAVATLPVGSYQPNVWGLHDMHGNAAEWTHSDYRPYPYNSGAGREGADTGRRKAVRGGSWVDRPRRCRCAFRLGFPTWQRVHNVGFRVVVACE